MAGVLWNTFSKTYSGTYEVTKKLNAHDVNKDSEDITDDKMVLVLQNVRARGHGRIHIQPKFSQNVLRLTKPRTNGNNPT